MTDPHLPLHVLVVGAHPDEADMYAGGTAALYAALGHDVTFLSLTCGDAGHHEIGRFALAARRADEAQEAARRLGVRAYRIEDVHDGELMPTLHTRLRVLHAIRTTRADVVLSLHYAPDGHPDHRASGRATVDAVQFATLRNVLPEVPALERPPLHLLMPDYGSRAVHRHDVAVDVDATIEQKLGACDAHATQFYEFAPYGRGFLAEVPCDKDWDSKRAYLLKHWAEFMYAQPDMRTSLASWYGSQHAQLVTFAETFQYSPRGAAPDPATVRRLLPMLSPVA
jgi:LmbE family N-acetylglucosaminyl deacetylase